MNTKFKSVKLISGKTEEFPTNQYKVSFGSNDYVCWTPHELETNRLYCVEFQEEKSIKDGNEWLKLQKIRVSNPKNNDLTQTLKDNKPSTEQNDKAHPIYHQMAMDYLWKTNKLSLSAISKLAPHFKDICEGTIDKDTLALLDLEFYDATAVI